jgi:hypothetical protein
MNEVNYNCCNEIAIECADEQVMQNILTNMQHTITVEIHNGEGTLESTEPIDFSFEGLLPLGEDSVWEDRMGAWGCPTDRKLIRLNCDGLTIFVYCLTEFYAPIHVCRHLRKYYDCEIDWFFRCDEHKQAGWL